MVSVFYIWWKQDVLYFSTVSNLVRASLLDFRFLNFSDIVRSRKWRRGICLSAAPIVVDLAQGAF